MSAPPEHEVENKGIHNTFIGTLTDVAKTGGTKVVDEAFTKAGGSTHHTPGAASKLGSQEQDGANEGHGLSGKAMRTADPNDEPSLIGKMANQLMNGSGKAASGESGK